MRTVVAALIIRDLKLLVCQRRRDDTQALRWEFPGGKVEAGESPEKALARELQEELGVAAIIGSEVYRTQYRYSQFHDQLELIFYRAKIEDSALLQNLAFETFEWASPASLPQYDFLPADKELIHLLAAGSIQPA